MKRLIFALLVITAGSIPALAKYSGGTGEPNDPYQIATSGDLLTLAADTNDYNQCFILTADISMGIGMEWQVFTTAIIAADTSSSDGFQGTTFTGTFDGNSHKITNFAIDGGSNDCLGLFGKIDSGGSVKNLGLENCAVSGDSESVYVGGLVGRNYGSISNCYSTGMVSGHFVVGGLVGYNYHGSISNCYSTGAVGGSGSSDVGGLVGINSGSISNCYSTGTVSGSLEVGGLVGYNYQGSISNCYSTGAVSGTSYVGGLVGYNYGSVSSSFWDTETSGQTTSTGGTGKTTAEMKQVSTFANWDFVETWGIEDNQTYPFLKLTYPVGDLNHDKVVDLFDFAILAEHWLQGL